jgi:hypothetical protein
VKPGCAKFTSIHPTHAGQEIRDSVLAKAQRIAQRLDMGSPTHAASLQQRQKQNSEKSLF